MVTTPRRKSKCCWSPIRYRTKLHGLSKSPKSSRATESELNPKENSRSLHCATPDFLLNLVTLVHFMRPPLGKGAYAALSSAAWKEIRLRTGRDDASV